MASDHEGAEGRAEASEGEPAQSVVLELAQKRDRSSRRRASERARRGRKEPVRSHVIPRKLRRVDKAELAEGAAEYPDQPGRDYERPKKRGDCWRYRRLCPGCKGATTAVGSGREELCRACGGTGLRHLHLVDGQLVPVDEAGYLAWVAARDQGRVRPERMRPCIFVSCRHHLYLDVNPSNGSIKLLMPHKEIEDMQETCALDMADRGTSSLEQVGAVFNCVRERARQLEGLALARVEQITGVSLLDFVGDGERSRRRLPMLTDEPTDEEWERWTSDEEDVGEGDEAGYEDDDESDLPSNDVDDDGDNEAA